MKKNSTFLACFSVSAAIFLLLGSCDDIIAKDISETTPVIVLPSANDTIPANPVHFKWNAVEGATKYHLEIVSPSFAALNDFTVDSIVTGTNFYIALDSAQYEFRLTALNAGYVSKTTTPRIFWVGTSLSPVATSVVLNTPADQAYFNENFNGQYSWEILNGASHYMFELHKGTTFADPTVDIVPDLQSWTVSSYDGTQLAEGTYTWGVKAYLSNGNETVYTKRTFYIDTINPGLAVNTSPGHNTIVSAGDVIFSWNLPADNGLVQSPLISKLEISTTTNFSNPQVQTTSGNTRVVSLSAGTYYWRVRISDEAGNAGPTPSGYFTLTVF